MVGAVVTATAHGLCLDLRPPWRAQWRQLSPRHLRLSPPWRMPLITDPLQAMCPLPSHTTRRGPITRRTDTIRQPTTHLLPRRCTTPRPPRERTTYLRLRTMRDRQRRFTTRLLSHQATTAVRRERPSIGRPRYRCIPRRLINTGSSGGRRSSKPAAEVRRLTMPPLQCNARNRGACFDTVGSSMHCRRPRRNAQ